MNCRIKEITKSDWNDIAEIYLEGINTNKATFQTEIPTWENWNTSHISSCRLEAILDNKILGWAALSPTSSRCVYVGVAEVSIYICKNSRGQGIGTVLLENLIKISEKNGFWTLQSAIIRENSASIALHKKCGFREIGVREKLGKMRNGIWHDVILMERRSKLVGIN